MNKEECPGTDKPEVGEIYYVHPGKLAKLTYWESAIIKIEQARNGYYTALFLLREKVGPLGRKVRQFQSNSRVGYSLIKIS